jgi:hypothetical protein
MAFSQQIQDWVNQTKSQVRRVVGGSASDLAELMTIPQLSIKVTGYYVEGKVPVDTRALLESFEIYVSGNFQKRGSRGLDNLINELVIGDNVQFVFTAPYASYVEYGTSLMAGRFFVRNAYMQWPVIVAQNVAFVRSGL